MAETPSKRPRNTHASGLKRLRIELPRGDDNKRHQKDFYGKTIKECREKIKLYMEGQKQAQEQAQDIIPEPPGLTVAQWADRWLSAYGQGAGYSTNRTTEINCRKLVDALGMMQLADVRNEDIQRFANSCAHYAKSTVLKIKLTAGSIFKRAVENSLIDRSPCDSAQWRYVGAGTHRCLTDDEINTICAYWAEQRIGICVMLMLWAGLRRGEALALRWTDIDMEGKQLHVRQGVHFEVNQAVVGPPKTQTSIRSIPILPPLYEALKRLQMPPCSPFVCTGADGNQVTLAAWNGAWDSYLASMTNCLHGEKAVRPGRRSDLDDMPRKLFVIRAHDLRHTYASMLYDAGVDPKTAQKLLGHASLATTMQIYVHLQSRREKFSLDAMDAYSSRFASHTLQLPSYPPIAPGK